MSLLFPVEAAQRRRPLVGIALSHIAGLILGSRWASPDVWGYAAAATLALALMCVRRRAATPLLFSALLLLGGFHAALHRPGLSAQSLERILEAPRETLRLSGIVIDDPAHRAPTPDTRERLGFSVRVDRLHRLLPGWQQVRGRATVYVQGDWEDGCRPMYGDRVLIDGVVSRDPPHFLYVSPGNIQRLSSGHGSKLVALAYRWRAASLARIARFREQYPGETGVLQAMLLGHRSDLPEPVHSTFRVTGAGHILAISGLHIGIILALLLGLLRLTGLSRRWWFLALAPVLLAYMTAAGLPRSAIRATLMALTYGAAPVFRRKPDALCAISLAALLILLVDPLSIQDPGFIFSFTIVTGLLTLAPGLARRWGHAETPHPDDWGPNGPGPGRRLVRALRRRAIDLVVLAGVAWLVSLPLMARYSNLFAPAGLIANLLLIPAAFAVVGTGVLGLFLDASFPWLAEGSFAVARFVAGGLIRSLHFLAEIPGSHFFVRAPPIPLIALWYLGLALIFRGRTRPRYVTLGLGAATALAAVVWTWAPGPVRIEIPNASAGCGPLVQRPDGRRLLFDPGPAYHSRRAVRFLRSRGVNRIDTLVLTRADARHMGATPELADLFRVREVWVPDYPALSSVFRKTLSDLEEKGIRIRRLAAGQHAQTGALTWEVLYPLEEREGNRADQNDLVLRLAYGGRSVLFAGSAGGETATRIGRRPDAAPEDFRADILLRTREDWAETEPWLDWVRPRVLAYPLETHAVSDRPPHTGTEYGTALHPVPYGEHLSLRARARADRWRIRREPD